MVERRMGRRKFLRDASLIGIGVGATAAGSGFTEIAGQLVTIMQKLESAQQHFAASEGAVRVGQTEGAEQQKTEAYQQIGVVNHISRDDNPRRKAIGGVIVSLASAVGIIASSEAR